MPTEVEKRAVVRIGGLQKAGDGPSLAARGLLTIVSLKYWHSQLMAVYSDRASVREENNTRRSVQMEEGCEGDLEISN